MGTKLIHDTIVAMTIVALWHKKRDILIFHDLLGGMRINKYTFKV